jgi:hypothetical protein
MGPNLLGKQDFNPAAHNNSRMWLEKMPRPLIASKKYPISRRICNFYENPKEICHPKEERNNQANRVTFFVGCPLILKYSDQK